MSLVRLRLEVFFSSETGESNLHHIYAAIMMNYNKENKHVMSSIYIFSSARCLISVALFCAISRGNGQSLWRKKNNFVILVFLLFFLLSPLKKGMTLHKDWFVPSLVEISQVVMEKMRM